MSLRTAALVILGVFIVSSTGCSRGKPVSKSPPSGKPSDSTKDTKPAAPPPEPEPGPGEPVPLIVPKDGGLWPWNVARAEEFAAARPVPFPGLAPFAITGFAVRPELNRAIVSMKWEKKGQPIATRMALCDTAAGKLLTEWQLPGLQTVLDVSPDGRAFLSTGAQQGSGRTILRLWVISSDGQLHRLSWAAHTPNRVDGICQEPGERSDSISSMEIRWAGFVGNDRIASYSRFGQLRVFDVDAGKPLYILEGTPGRPAITPDGSKIAIFTGSAVTLVDPSRGVVVGSHPLGTLPQHPTLAFSPDGGKLAIGGNGKALFLDLKSGDVREAVLPKLHVTDTGMYDKPFGWAGNRFLYADGHLFDTRFPGSVWDYPGADCIQFHGSRIWACSHPVGSSITTLAAYELPHLPPLLNVAAAASRPGLIALRTGDAIQIEIAGIPEDHRADVKKALEQRLKALGYRVEPSAPAVLFASVDATANKTLTAYSGLESISYQKKHAVLRLMMNGQELWSEAWAIEPPFKIRLAPGETLADHLKQAAVGEPNYKLFAEAPLPASFPGPNALTPPLGSTDLNLDRLKGWLTW